MDEENCLPGFLLFVGRKYDLTLQISDNPRTIHHIPSRNYSKWGKAQNKMLLCEGGLRLGTLILQDVYRMYCIQDYFCPVSFFLAQLHFYYSLLVWIIPKTMIRYLYIQLFLSFWNLPVLNSLFHNCHECCHIIYLWYYSQIWGLLNVWVLFFFQYNFVRAEDGLRVSRETFMMVLVDITAIHIRANYFTPTTEARWIFTSIEQRVQ